MNGVSVNFSDLTQEQQDFIVDFLEINFTMRETINPKYSAYGLKQTFSRKYFFVTQEQFTEAMRRAGFTAQSIGHGNAVFNISSRSPFLKIR